MTIEELLKEIETQYNLNHQTKIKITLPEEIKNYEIFYYEKVLNKPYNVEIEEVELTKLTNRIVLK